MNTSDIEPKLVFASGSKGIETQEDSEVFVKTSKRSLWQAITFEEGAMAHINQDLKTLYGKTGVL